jgi:hypothetical protein
MFPLNARRLEDAELTQEFENAFEAKDKLEPFVQRFKSKLKPEEEKPIEENFQKEAGISTDTEENHQSPYKGKNSEESLQEEKDTALEPENAVEEEVFEDDTEEFLDLDFDILVGKASESQQYGILGKTLQNKTIALDLSDTNTISLFGVVSYVGRG